MTDSRDTWMTRGTLLLGGALAGGLAMLGGLWALGFLITQQDEVGIRVKNGSAFLETISGDGFNQVGNDFESKRGARQCFTVVVSTTLTCQTGPARSLVGVNQLRFWTSDSGAPNAVHRINTGGKFKTMLNKRWAFIPPANQNRVQHPEAVYLLKMEAQAPGGALQCDLGPNPDDDWIELYNVC